MYDLGTPPAACGYLGRRRSGLALTASFALAATSLFSAERAVADDWSSHASVGLDLGLGGIITRYSPDAQDGGSVLTVSLRGNYDLSPDFSLALLLRQWSLPGSNHATMLPGAGARFEPFQGSFGRAFVDATVGPSWTRDRWTLGYDLGAGFDLDLPMVAGLALGPSLRYGQVINPSTGSSSDGRAWALALGATFHFGRRAAATAHAPGGGQPVRPFQFKVADSDHDGVSDERDQCPEVPAGRHPDTFRPGCPENDDDGDGVPDSDDVCPTTPSGDTPDRERRGCPFIDSDGDGIGDADDHCPDKAGPATKDPNTNGCPVARKAAVRPEGDEPPAEADTSVLRPVPKRRLTRPSPSATSTPAPSP